jgi:hypothetical protein
LNGSCKNFHPLSGEGVMAKQQKGNKESKKKPLLSPKEKKAAKAARKAAIKGNKGLLD